MSESLPSWGGCLSYWEHFINHFNIGSAGERHASCSTVRMKPKTATSASRAKGSAKPAKRSPSYSGAVRGPESSKASESGTELPHERDETTDPRAKDPKDPAVEQAYRDVESGQADTDLRGTATGIFKRAPKAPRSR